MNANPCHPFSTPFSGLEQWLERATSGQIQLWDGVKQRGDIFCQKSRWEAPETVQKRHNEPPNYEIKRGEVCDRLGDRKVFGWSDRW